MSATQRLSENQFVTKRHVDRQDEDLVYSQLTKDYPKEALGWIHNVDWSGPKKVPLNQIEWNDERTWKATKDKAHVKHFVDMINSGQSQNIKPVVLIGRPGKPTLMITDGHHRALAYKEAGKSAVPAWVGQAHHIVGEWDYLHDAQFKESKKGTANW